MPHYVPGDKPAVPGHETVDPHRQGRRQCQAPQGWASATWCKPITAGCPPPIPTPPSATTLKARSRSMFFWTSASSPPRTANPCSFPSPEDLSASALALVEPWACVEDSYVEKQRQTLKNGGQMLVVGETLVDKSRVWSLPGKPKTTTFTTADKIAELADAAFDDVIYFGSNPATVEKLFPKVARRRLVQHRSSRRQVWPPGRVASRPRSLRRHPPHRHHRQGPRRRHGRHSRHGGNPSQRQNQHHRRRRPDGHDARHPRPLPGRARRDGVRRRPERRAFGRAAKAGRAAGRQEQTHAAPLQSVQGQTCRTSSITSFSWRPCPRSSPRPSRTPPPRAIINIFAGIPADKTAALDLDAYIEKQLYFIGTSGSVLEDMKQVLAKVVSRRLDTNLSVAAVSGLDGAIDGIRAVEKNLMPGKIHRLSFLPRIEADPADRTGRLASAFRRPLEQTGRRSSRETIPDNMSADLQEQNRHRHRRRAGLGPGHLAAARPRRLQGRHRRHEREGRRRHRRRHRRRNRPAPSSA